MTMDQRLAEIIESASKTVHHALQMEAPGGGLVLAAKQAGDRPVMACRSPAMATIRQGIDGRLHFVVSGPLESLTGEAVGHFRGVFQAKIFSKTDLFDYPDPPSRPFDRPWSAGEAESPKALNPTKSEWTFDRLGHRVTGSGYGMARIAIEPFAGSHFWLSATSFLWGHSGSGVADHLGQAATLATATFPSTPSLVDGVSFPIQLYHYLTLSPISD